MTFQDIRYSGPDVMRQGALIEFPETFYMAITLSAAHTHNKLSFCLSHHALQFDQLNILFAASL